MAVEFLSTKMVQVPCLGWLWPNTPTIVTDKQVARLEKRLKANFVDLYFPSYIGITTLTGVYNSDSEAQQARH